MLKILSVPLYLLLVLCLVQLAFGQSSKGELDFSGLEKYWPIYDTLAADKEPPQTQWDELFATPAYKLLEQREGKRPIAEAFRIAYKPSRSTDRDKILKDNKGWWGFIVVRLIDVPKHREQITAFIQRDKIEAIAAKARVRAQKFLPEGTVKRFPAPPVSFFVYQSRGYTERILLDPIEITGHADPVGLLGHEFHHHYRSKIGKKFKPFDDNMLPWVFVNVEDEGVAGLSDKREAVKMSDTELEKYFSDKVHREYFREYRSIYAKSNEWLAFTENYLEEIAGADESKAKELSKKLHSALPDNGRAMGTYMSEVMIKHLGKKRFIATVGDPIAFWLTYNEAAKRTGGKSHVLSGKAIAVIIKVREQYQLDQK